MAEQWVHSLDGKVVVVTGRTKPRLGYSRAEVDRLLRRAGARVGDKVSKNTDVLVRGESDLWKFGDYGVDEDDAARLQGEGRKVVVVTLDGLGALLEGRPAQTIAPHADAPAKVFGAPYRDPQPPEHGKPVRVFEHDPVAMERGLQAHVNTQQALRDAVIAAGLVPLSSFSTECDYDLSWSHDDTVVVAEVKSLTSQNERAQLRLGLGQVLDYAEHLRSEGWTVQPVLAVEKEPTVARWMSVCSASGVRLVWPESFSSLFG